MLRNVKINKNYCFGLNSQGHFRNISYLVSANSDKMSGFQVFNVYVSVRHSENEYTQIAIQH